MEDSVKAALDILRIMAMDPPMSKVTLMITLFNRITCYIRSKKETNKVFSDRFRGLAVE